MVRRSGFTKVVVESWGLTQWCFACRDEGAG